eukprot:TRINITY_DN9207_c0_g1_i1.p1 TRINITY_DN9207_c0_g1~~TRINITY_DN9207_c0_g1_i1.p1  ORF type:complete len:566 (+),score=202.91 TRINITY_DN9207_c0_g1_i1:68-1699(+)
MLAVTYFLAALLLIAFLFYWKFVRPHKTLLSDVPGPTPTPFFGNAPHQDGTFMTKYREWTATYGRICKFFIGMGPRVMISDQEDAHRIMVDDFKDFPQRKNHYKDVFKALRNGLLWGSGEEWKQRRRMVSRAFNVINLRRMTPLINKNVDVFLDLMDRRLVQDKGEVTLDITKLVHPLAMDNIACAAFGLDANAQQAQYNEERKGISVSEYSIGNLPLKTRMMISHSSDPTIPLLIDTLGDWAVLLYLIVFKNSVMRARIWFNSYLRPQILERASEYRADRGQNDDDSDAEDEEAAADVSRAYLGETNILKLLVEKDKVTGDEIPADQVYTQALELLVAGYETVATTLGYCVYILSQHPAVIEKIRLEVAAVRAEVAATGGDGAPGHLSYAHYSKLTYTAQAIKEVMRIRPSVGRTNRENGVAVSFHGHAFPPGNEFQVCIDAMHNNARYFPHPERFDPDRFSPQAEAARNKTAPASYIPFGYGPRICVGHRFAMMQLVLVVARVMTSYNFELLPGQETLRIGEGITNLPIDGINVKITRASS